jgi:hypothetical protein
VIWRSSNQDLLIMSSFIVLPTTHVDMDEIDLNEWGASATGTSHIVVSHSWHKMKCHNCPTRCS